MSTWRRFQTHSYQLKVVAIRCRGNSAPRRYYAVSMRAVPIQFRANMTSCQDDTVSRRCRVNTTSCQDIVVSETMWSEHDVGSTRHRVKKTLCQDDTVSRRGCGKTAPSQDDVVSRRYLVKTTPFQDDAVSNNEFVSTRRRISTKPCQHGAVSRQRRA